MKTKKIINELLVSAVANKVSDIFFFPKREETVVEFRTIRGV